MKKLVILLLLIIPIFTFAQKGNVTWDYPVKPGSEEWKNINKETDRIKTMQIPDEIIDKMEAMEFAITIVNFPLFGYYSAFNTPQEGFNIMFSRFNIFQKVCKKKSIGKHLIEIYKDAEIDGWKSKANILNNDFWTLKYNYLEYLLSQEEIIMNLNSIEKKELIKEALVKLNQKGLHKSFNSLTGLGSSMLVISRILENENEIEEPLLSNTNFQSFIKTGHLENEKIKENLIIFANNYLTKNN